MCKTFPKMITLPSNEKAIYLFTIKWLPVLGVFLIQVHYILILCGHRSMIMDYIAEMSLFSFIFTITASKLFFCRLHQVFVWYIGVASLDIDLHHWFALPMIRPDWIIPAIMIPFAAVIICLAIFTKTNLCHNHEEH